MPKKPIRVSFELEDDAAEAFIDLLTKMMRVEPSTSKASLGRAAFFEYANARGFNLKDDTQWGGKRAEEGQIAGAIAV